MFNISACYCCSSNLLQSNTIDQNISFKAIEMLRVGRATKFGINTVIAPGLRLDEND